MSAPRTKRQFAGAASDPAQRRITSFFSSSGAVSSSTCPDDALARGGGLAAVDSSVQANLLSVGMRVRKAVPEGYKTNGYSAFSLWDENNNTTSRSNREMTAPTKTTYDATGRSRSGAASVATTPRELLPFCGIHKIGGMDTQKPNAADDYSFSLPSTEGPLGLLDPDSMDEVPGLTLSQESVESNNSIEADTFGSRTRKRFFADEESADFPDFGASSRSLAPVDPSNGRRLATPRKTRLSTKLDGPGPVGQENVMVLDDFEEASFLDPNVEVDMDDL
ncbi:hypothetical protein PFICI_02872 [Pestalotiopsis fici W106-1]|uniref:Uncharacterized protein n=1 Tax=Pestalotiopsis fici (strain W106-1 / CGMCC3.15140) TaxID=1229662 RepID=W3XHE4_PESFW|nr:uncharacterized protein PFICI_02872 [Pestalotiopsis fici W106-1]ETS84847.1 hypothetical protein PFICI_02872 [Pestalotiopsis fici W106-1]